MTILVMGTIKFGEGRAAEARELLIDHAVRVREEEGCEHYVFTVDLIDSDLVHVAERWALVDAMTAHIRADHQKLFGKALRAHAPLSMKIDAWDGHYWRNLIGADVVHPEGSFSTRTLFSAWRS